MSVDYAPARWSPSPSYWEGRHGFEPQYVVMHGTGGLMPGCLDWLCSAQSGASVHYLIDRAGVIHQLVAEQDSAWGNGIPEAPSAFVGGANPNLFCVTAETRILTDGLNWVPAGDLAAGDGIVGFDEQPVAETPRRQLRRAIVVDNSLRRDRVFALHLQDGPTLYATGEHRWLSRRSAGSGHGTIWRSTEDIARRVGAPRFLSRPEGERESILLPRYFNVHQPESNWGAGYLAGVYDGEGSMRYVHGEVHQLQFAQNAGVVLSTVAALLRERNYDFFVNERPPGGCRFLVLRGGQHEVLRFLGTIRPARLLGRWREDILAGCAMTKIEAHAILAVEDAGMREIAALGSSTLTYIAEGFGAHNTISVEHERDQDNMSAITPKQQAASAALVADIRRRHGPLALIPHSAISPQSRAHCPGPGFPLDAIDRGGQEPAGVGITWVRFDGTPRHLPLIFYAAASLTRPLYASAATQTTTLHFDGWRTGALVTDPRTGQPNGRWFHRNNPHGQQGWTPSAWIDGAPPRV